MHKLMIKTHNKTGLKYLCYTRSSGDRYENYKGSGTRWREHLKKHGDDISTVLIFESEDKAAFIAEAIKCSHEFNVVESSEWANLKLEEGDGGDTVSNRQWVTDGKEDKYIYKTDQIPDGWRKGRSNCVFNDSANQLKFAKLATTESRVTGMSKAWADGKMSKRDNTNIGLKLTSAGRKKISDTLKRKVEIDGVVYDSCKDAAAAFNVSCGLITYWIKIGKAKKHDACS